MKLIAPPSNTKAIIIFGAVTSGKSTLAKTISGNLNIQLINEDTVGPYYKILDKIDPYSYKEAIYEHCWIYKKFFLFKHLYEKSLFVFLKIDELLLKSNYEKRLKQSTKGDFSKMDPIQQQNQIISDLHGLQKDIEQENMRFLALDLNSEKDYPSAVTQIQSAFKSL